MNLEKYLNKKKFPGFSTLKDHFQFFIDQLIDENEISKDLKHECLDSICSSYITNKAELIDHCNSFFNSKQLIGTKCLNSEKNNLYVRVNGKASLVKWISEITGLSLGAVNSTITTILYSSNPKLKNGMMNKLFNVEANNASYMIPDNCLKFFGKHKWTIKHKKPTLKDAFLTNFNYIQWSFPDSKTENLFNNQASIDIVPCRAGLAFAEEKLIFSHSLNDTYNVRKPTVFDARLYPQFRPGGLTKPLSNCSHLTGFEEFVHIPNNFKNIDELIAETFYRI